MTYLGLLFVPEVGEYSSDCLALCISNCPQTVSGVRSDHEARNVRDDEPQASATRGANERPPRGTTLDLGPQELKHAREGNSPMRSGVRGGVRRACTHLIENVRKHVIGVWSLSTLRSRFSSLSTEHARKVREEVRRCRRVCRTLLLGLVQGIVLYPSFWVRQDEICIGYDLC